MVGQQPHTLHDRVDACVLFTRHNTGLFAADNDLQGASSGASFGSFADAAESFTHPNLEPPSFQSQQASALPSQASTTNGWQAPQGSFSQPWSQGPRHDADPVLSSWGGQGAAAHEATQSWPQQQAWSMSNSGHPRATLQDSQLGSTAEPFSVPQLPTQHPTQLMHVGNNGFGSAAGDDDFGDGDGFGDFAAADDAAVDGASHLRTAPHSPVRTADRSDLLCHQKHMHICQRHHLLMCHDSLERRNGPQDICMHPLCPMPYASCPM